MIIDAVGKACPMPVVLAKKEIDENHGNFIIRVDNQIAIENLKKLARKMNYTTQVAEKDGIFEVSFISGDDQVVAVQKVQTPKMEKRIIENAQYVVFMGKEMIGDGDLKLGSLLTEMFFYTLSESDDLPESILFMNGGVKIVAAENRTVGHLKTLRERGVNILVCGTCLDFYQLTDSLAIGEVSNMYDITEKMLNAHKVVTL
ncbi:sulfurtransferase-like selenium metabolism protein YedF [Eubacteriaceae bacterium ES3]|nr:sulfurtransferase-like selenium metabolism protein YedF [Eubacteriaceae bacterium ES3]